MPEYLDIYDIHRNLTGKQVIRGRDRLAPGEYLLVIHVLIFDRAGRFLTQKRVENKARNVFIRVRIYCAAVFTMMRCELVILFLLVSSENIAGVHFGGNIVKDGVVTIGDDSLGTGLEGGKIVHYERAEEG